MLCILQVNLTTLDVASNRIKVVENISHLIKLEEFWVCVFLSVVVRSVYVSVKLCF